MISVFEAYIQGFLIHLFLTVFFIISLKADHQKWNGHLTAGLIILWGSFIFNIIYTGLMGWNRKPASDLERWLDIISISGFFFAIVILTTFTALAEKKKGKS